MKRALTILLALVLCFSGCSIYDEETVSEKAAVFCGTVEENVYKNEMFDISFEIPEDWNAIEPETSENNMAYFKDWTFEEKEGFGSVEMCLGYCPSLETKEDAFDYIFNFVDDVYGESIVEKKTETLFIGDEEKNVVLLELKEGSFECYVGVIEKLAFYEDESWLYWGFVLFETEKEVKNAIEIITSGEFKKEIIVPAIGTYDGDVFVNEAFGIGFVVPKDWYYAEPEMVPYEKTEKFYDWEFYASYGYGGIRLYYMKFTEDIDIQKEKLIEVSTGTATGEGEFFEERKITTVMIDGKEELCAFGYSEDSAVVFIPKVLEDDDGGWVCGILLTANSEDELFEYIEKLTFDVEKTKEMAKEIEAEYDFEFVPGTLNGNTYYNEFSGISFETPKGWEYDPEENCYRDYEGDGYFEEFSCSDGMFLEIDVIYQKYNYYGGKAATFENFNAIRWYEDDNKYGAKFVSETIETIEHCGKELVCEKEVYTLNGYTIYFDTLFLEKENYYVIIYLTYEGEDMLYDLLSYINID